MDFLFSQCLALLPPKILTFPPESPCVRVVIYIETSWTGKKVESRNGPGVAQRIPGGLGSQISWHSACESGKVVSLTRRPPLPPGMFLVLIFTTGWVDPRAVVWSEGNMGCLYPKECSWYSFSLGAELTPGPWYGRKEIWAAFIPRNVPGTHVH
jgi:hypothetical protein